MLVYEDDNDVMGETKEEVNNVTTKIIHVNNEIGLHVNKKYLII